MANLIDLKKELQDLRESTMSEFSALESTGFDAEKKGEWDKRNERMSELVTSIKEATKIETEKKELEEAIEAGKVVEPKGIHFEKAESEAPLTLGGQFLESNAYKAFAENGQKNITSELKFNVGYKADTTTGTMPPSVIRSPRIQESAQRDPFALPNLIDTITTDQTSYKYLEETTFTNAGGPIAEGGTYAEDTLAFTERTEVIRKIGSFIPMTDELLADVPAAQGYIDSRLQFMVNSNIQDQILGGSGAGNNLTGFLNKTGINTFNYANYTPATGLKRIGQVLEAITEIQKDSFLNPDAILMHPSDWYQVITETSAVTTSGSHNPLFVGAGDFGSSVAATLWGLPVVPTTQLSAGTALVGVFGGGQACHLVARQGMEVSMSDSHDANFVKDIVVMKASVRIGLPIYRASAFCSITNF